MPIQVKYEKARKKICVIMASWRFALTFYGLEIICRVTILVKDEIAVEQRLDNVVYTMRQVTDFRNNTRNNIRV
jgi:hypothetical protein